MSFLLKMIGGRVGAGLFLALIGTGAWGWFQSAEADAERKALEQALADKAVITERLSQVAMTANENAAEAARAREQARERESAVARLQRRLTAARADTEDEIDNLREVTTDAPDDYQTCTADVRTPAAVGRMLYVSEPSASGSGDADSDGVRDAAGADAGALPDPTAEHGHADAGAGGGAGAEARQGAGILQPAVARHSGLHRDRAGVTL